MNSLKHRLSFFLFIIFCFGFGGIIYSQIISAGNIETNLFPGKLKSSNNRLSSGSNNFLLKPRASIQSDSNTKLFLDFDNNLNGEQGETPVSSSGFNFQTGIRNQSVFLGNPNQLIPCVQLKV